MITISIYPKTFIMSWLYYTKKTEISIEKSFSSFQTKPLSQKHAAA
jgi:hypothetical protein